MSHLSHEAITAILSRCKPNEPILANGPIQVDEPIAADVPIQVSSKQADAEVIYVDVIDGFVLHYLCSPKRKKPAIDGTVGEIQTELQESAAVFLSK